MDMDTRYEVAPFMFSGQDISDLLTTAFEGGSTYWIISAKTDQYPEGAKWLSDVVSLGGTVRIEHPPVKSTENGPVTTSLDIVKAVGAFTSMAGLYPRHFANLIPFDDVKWDAETADVWLQCALFGEIIFG